MRKIAQPSKPSPVVIDPARLPRGLQRRPLPRDWVEQVAAGGAIRHVREALTADAFHDLLLGRNGREFRGNLTPMPQDTAMVVTYTRVLAQRGEINRNVFGRALEHMEVDADNAIVLLDYLREHASLDGAGLPLRSAWLWDRISPQLDRDKPMVRALLASLARSLAEVGPPSELRIATGEACAPVITLAIVARLPGHVTHYRLMRLLNYQLGLFPDLKRLFAFLNERGWLVEKDHMHATPQGLDALDTFDIPATLDTIRPEDATVFDDFTRLLW